jgi:hypothetical protein
MSVRAKRRAVCVGVPAKGWAREAKSIAKGCPQAEKVAVAVGNLNAHAVSSLYEAFPALETF